MRYKPRHSIRPVRGRDLDTLRKWYKARGMQPPRNGLLSDLTFICDDRVAGSLYITNGNIAMIEGVISNPNTVPSLRRESLKHLCSYLVDMAYELGYTNIFGITKHPSIKQICKDLGFKADTFEVWALSEE